MIKRLVDIGHEFTKGINFIVPLKSVEWIINDVKNARPMDLLYLFVALHRGVEKTMLLETQKNPHTDCYVYIYKISGHVIGISGKMMRDDVWEICIYQVVTKIEDGIKHYVVSYEEEEENE